MTDTDTSNDEQHDEQHDDGPDNRERYKVAGDKVVAKIKELLHEGNIRHVVIKNDEGRTLIEFPVTMGVAGALLLPVWAAVGAVAAVVASCTIEVERRTDADEESDAE